MQHLRLRAKTSTETVVVVPWLARMLAMTNCRMRREFTSDCQRWFKVYCRVQHFQTRSLCYGCGCVCVHAKNSPTKTLNLCMGCRPRMRPELNRCSLRDLQLSRKLLVEVLSRIPFRRGAGGSKLVSSNQLWKALRAIPNAMAKNPICIDRKIFNRWVEDRKNVPPNWRAKDVLFVQQHQH